MFRSFPRLHRWHSHLPRYHQRSQDVWIVMLRWLLITSARFWTATAIGRMLKVTTICTCQLIWTVKIGQTSLLTVFTDFMGQTLESTICDWNRNCVISSWWEVALIRAIFSIYHSVLSLVLRYCTTLKLNYTISEKKKWVTNRSSEIRKIANREYFFYKCLQSG